MLLHDYITVYTHSQTRTEKTPQNYYIDQMLEMEFIFSRICLIHFPVYVAMYKCMCLVKAG